MRRDIFICNDSGGLSLVAGNALNAIIEDDRSNDLAFVQSHSVLLQQLYGDDSMPIRIVVDEPLSVDEQAQWLAHVAQRLDVSDGRLLIAGGFDPTVFSDWRDESEKGDFDPFNIERGTTIQVSLTPGMWRVDLYAHVGSMNGRYLLEQGYPDLIKAFHDSHPEAPLPAWLAKLVAWSGQDSMQEDVATRAIDKNTLSFIGFLVHLRRETNDIRGEELSPLPDDGWFAIETNARTPKPFPRGLPSFVRDDDLESFLKYHTEKQG